MTSLLIASTGGHLAQLWRLWPRIQASGVDDAPLWLTFDTPQSRSLLAGQRTIFLRFTASRDFRSIVANVPEVVRILRSEHIDRAFSTGSGVALSVFPLARAMGIDCHYIESAARSAGPSLTGKALQFVPGVQTYCQYPNWASDRWRYVGSVFDDFSAAPTIESPIRRIVVMLGTIPFPFHRLVQRLRNIVPSNAEVLWQLGPKTPADGLSDAHTVLPEKDLRKACRQADLIVTHAGIGSALMALESGKTPILVSRSRIHGEHIDDHQQYIATELARRGLAVHAAVNELDGARLETAARGRVDRVHHHEPLAFSF
jgi:UDP-N-acetylglucosamine--N-acetylmuramyl-(pentapeptide) pyrophosphoryl-undecaprenol N-acetylglucosamine transferase